MAAIEAVTDIFKFEVGTQEASPTKKQVARTGQHKWRTLVRAHQKEITEYVILFFQARF